MTEPALQGRVIVIVGGTTGLGLSAATACIASGARVVTCGKNTDSSLHAQQLLGERAQVLTADATLPTCAEELIEKAIAEFGGFDGMYHVAGGSGRQFGDGPLHELSDEAIDNTLRLNLTSLIYSNRAAARAFVDRKVPGTVLNMGSVLADHPSPEHFATHAYAAAKSAIVGFTKSCAAYYAPRNIRFNVIAPALVDTPMSSRASGDETIQAYIRRKQPLDGGRIGRCQDLDAGVVYLLSDQSRFVTGQLLSIDGGWSVTEGGAS